MVLALEMSLHSLYQVNVGYTYSMLNVCISILMSYI